jgi:hypothetical protein
MNVAPQRIRNNVWIIYEKSEFLEGEEKVAILLYLSHPVV